MKVVITATTEKGDSSTEQDVSQTFNEVMRIAGMYKGKLVYGRGLSDGTEIVLEK